MSSPSALDLRAAVCCEARRWLGTPWHHHARVIGAGVDCINLVVAVYESAGVLAPGRVELGDYPIDWHLHHDDDRMTAGLVLHGRPVVAPRPGDVALFRFGRVGSHVGLVLEDISSVLHAYAPHRAVTITDLRTAAYLADRLVGYYTLFEDGDTA